MNKIIECWKNNGDKGDKTVLFLCTDSKVFHSIVKPVPVYMVNNISLLNIWI